MAISAASDHLSDVITNITNSKSGNIVDKIAGFFNDNPLSSIPKSLELKPDQILYNSLLTDMNAIFLSDNPNDYVAAMCGLAQEYLLDKIDTINYEMADITNLISSYIDNLIREAEWLMEVKTFPNLISLCLDMQEQIVSLLTNVAALQGRIFTQGNYSFSRLEQIDQQIYELLANNAKIRRALGLYDPDAHSQTDLKEFIKYIKQRLEDLLKEIKNLGDFPDQFKAEMDPKEIMYKNFSRLYGYICKASKLISNNSMNWRKGKLKELKTNTFDIGQNLYKALVIVDKYKYSNMAVKMEEDERGTVIGRMLKELTTNIKNFDMEPFKKLIEELEYLVAVILKQAEVLALTPFQTLAAELQARGLPSNITQLFSKEGWNMISNGEWAKMYGFDKYLKLDIKEITLGLLREKGEKIGIPVDKIPKIETLITLGSRVKNLKTKISSELNNFKDLLSAGGDIRKAVPEEATKQLVDNLYNSSDVMAEAIATSDPAKMMKVLSSPNNLTKSGEIAENVSQVLADATSDPESGITVIERDVMIRAKELLRGDHLQDCTQKLLGMTGQGLDVMKPVLDYYVTEIYDNANAIFDALVKLYDTGVNTER